MSEKNVLFGSVAGWQAEFKAEIILWLKITKKLLNLVIDEAIKKIEEGG